MKQMVIRKVLCLIIAASMLLSSDSLGMVCHAKEIHGDYAEICKDGTPIRTGPTKEAEVVTTCDEGTVIKLEGGICNMQGNSWYIVRVNGEECYVYSGNLREHKCSFRRMDYNGTEYSYCSCGKINVVETKKISVNRAEAIALYAGEASMAAALDGPIPVVDFVGAMIFIIAAADSVLNGVDEQVVESIREIDITDLLEEETQCTDYNFRKVGFMNGNGGLYYIDDECLDMVQAYFYTLFIGNTYTKYEPTAKALASLWGECYPERDKDRPDHWYHYHFGNRNAKLGYHVFFGTNDYGEYPVSY